MPSNGNQLIGWKKKERKSLHDDDKVDFQTKQAFLNDFTHANRVESFAW